MLLLLFSSGVYLRSPLSHQQREQGWQHFPLSIQHLPGAPHSLLCGRQGNRVQPETGPEAPGRSGELFWIKKIKNFTLNSDFQVQAFLYPDGGVTLYRLGV